MFAGFHAAISLGSFTLTAHDTYVLVSVIWASWFLSTMLFRLYSEYSMYQLSDIYKATWRSVILHIILISAFALSIQVAFELIFIYSLIVLLAFLCSRSLCSILMPLIDLDFEERKANILAIASVGGHWIELLRIMPLFKGKSVSFISNNQSLKETVLGYSFHTVPDANKDSKFKLLGCIMKVSAYILFLRPQVIITTGAAPGLLGILIGKILGIKTIWIDSIANAEKLSLSGSIALWLADRVYTQWEHLAVQPKLVYSGNVL
ncbi:hypothetical protein [Mucilaginibacter antarcticus]|uniref:hypothetical protein n=1 Tax=Mucilaginibacter antarcticus TaxID=1855725 RepID=UPI00363209D6